MAKEILCKRVLIVEDDPDIRLSLCTLLEFHGYSCKEAEHGKTALKLIRIYDFDLIITDYQMPQMDGLELLRFLTEHPDIKRIPIIILSGSLDKFLFDEAMEGGAYAILQKPYAVDELLHMVKRATEGSPSSYSQSL